MARRCVYTVLTGGYEGLKEQPVVRTSAIPFICFSDNPALTSETWQIRPLSPLFPMDAHRSQREYKLRPHLKLPDFDQSLYIDNSVLLHAPPENIFAGFSLETGLALPSHSFRETLREEFLTVMQHRLDDPGRIAEQLEHYEAAYPDVLTRRPFWSAIMLRDHHNATMQTAMETWLAHILRYSRRDQLSSTAAFHQAGLKPVTMPIDNHKSWLHTWPHIDDRKTEQRIWSQTHPRYYPVTENFRLQLEILALERRLATLRRAHDATFGARLRRLLQIMGRG